MMEITAMSVVASICLAVCFYLLLNGGPVYRLWQLQSEIFRKHFLFLFITRSPKRVAAIHLSVCVVFLVFVAVSKNLPVGLLFPFLYLGPSFWLHRKESKKRELLSEQLAPWLTVLANSLKSSPNITDAFEASIALVQSPLRQEIDLLVKEVKLGEHLDRAMHRSASRIQSPLYSSVMTTLLVARKSGGNLPEVLEESSSTLREMERLAGVVRTKTAEGKSQTFVLALLPFAMAAMLQKVNPELIPSLWDTGTGQMILGASFLSWLAAVSLARKIVQVNI